MEFQKKSHDRWTDDEVQALLSIYAEDEIQRELETLTRNDEVYAKISSKLRELNIVHSRKRCREKLKKLKQDYKKIKNHNDRCGSDRRTSKWFDRLDALLGDRPAFSDPAATKHSMDTETDDQLTDEHINMELQKKSHDRWTDDEVQVLLNIYAEDEIQRELETATHNDKVYAEISSKLRELNIVHSRKQCREKLKKLKQDYKKIKNHNDSLGSDRRTSKWFERLDALLGHRPAFSGPAATKDSMDTETDDQSDEDVPVDLPSLENDCLEVPVNDERKVKCHLRIEDINPGVERTQGSTGDGAEDLLPSSRPNSCSTKITKKHSCPLCGKTFRKLSHIKQHRENVHIVVNLFECNQCGKRLKTKTNLKNHLQIHTGHKPHLCSYCGRGFRTKQILKAHVRTHTGERPYACTLCEKRFTQMNILKAHVRMHKGDRPFLCSDCGKAFCDSGALLVHSRYHTGERRYHCDVCGKDYITLQMLKTHQRFHTGERPYRCGACKKCFHTQNGLKKHGTTHTGEKPFQCLVCDHRCSQRSSLKVHMRTHR